MQYYSSNFILKICLVALILLIGFQGLLFYHYLENTKKAKQRVIHTYNVIAQLEHLNAMTFLDQNPKKIKQSVHELFPLIKDNPGQTFRLVQVGKLIGTQVLDKNKKLEFYKKITAMIDEEQRLLAIRYGIDEKAENKLISFISIVAFFCYITLLGMVFLLIYNLEKLEKTDKKLRESEHQLSLAISGTTDGLWDWDVVTNTVFYSPRLNQMLGFEENEMQNSPEAFISLIHPSDVNRVMTAVRAHFNERHPYNIEFKMRKKDGSIIWLQSRGQAIWNENGEVIRMSGFISDISSRKEIERMKDEFISTVSHELRTPLTSIRGSLGLILAGVGGDLSSKNHNLIDIAHKNCERLILIINDILDIEKIESGQIVFERKWVNLKKIVEQTLEFNQAYCEKFHVNCILKKPIPHANIYIDENRFMQVLTNLISNAAKFSPAGENIEILIEEGEKSIRFEVTDHGPGIPEEFKVRLFGKFAQADSSNTKQKGGTGLGLSISKAIIERFGGKIGYNNENNQTTFYFELPKIPEAEISILEKSPSKNRILVCEDHFDIAHLLKKTLEKQDFHVDIAFSANQAKDLLNKYSYAALTLDLILPDGNGIELIQDLRKQTKTQNLPIFVVSAKADEGKHILNGQAIGVIDWLNKPVDLFRLTEDIKRITSTKPKPTLLYVEDDKDLVDMITYSLSEIAEVLPAATLMQAKKYLSQKKVDLILLDVALPDGSGLQLLESLEENQLTPVIIFSASEISSEISSKVHAALVKSRTSESTIVSTIRTLIEQQTF